MSTRRPRTPPDRSARVEEQMSFENVTAALGYVPGIGATGATTAYVDAKIIDSIADSDTTHAPSRNAVFDALAGKETAGAAAAAQAAAEAYADTVGAAIVDGVTFTGDISVPDEAYDATAWNGSVEVPTKNAIRDKIESLATGGIVNGCQYIIDTGSTADSDPGNGILKFNNATQASATVLYLDDLTDDAVDMTALWAALVAGGLVRIQSAANQDTWQLWKTSTITDAAGYVKLTVVLMADGGAFADGDSVFVTIGQGATAGSGISSGASFPGSPADNDLYYRTDLDLLCFYSSSGTRWMTVNEYTLSSGSTATLMPHAASSFAPVRYPVPNDYGIYLTRMVLMMYVLTTSSGTQYWTLNLYQYNAADAQIGASLGAASTISAAANTNIRYDIALNVALDSTARVLYPHFVKVSTPGNLYPAYSLLYRKIIT